MNKKIVGLGLAAVAALSLAACSRSNSSSDSDSKVKVALVTDTGGIDDKSFNQSAWEGLQAWGKEHDLKKDTDYTFFQSNSESDYATNLDSAVSNGYNLVFGIGYNLHDAIDQAAQDNKDVNYVIVDDVVSGHDNVESVLFADNEGAYLAGIAAAMQSKTKHVGFVGGVESVDSSIKVDVQYVGSFADSAKGKTIAATMYAGGADVIYQAAGGSGTGVFSEAKEIDEKLPADSDKKVWVIGVDRDQADEGDYKASNKEESNFVLTSTIKKVGQVVQDISNEQLEGKKFEGDQTKTYGLADGGIDITTSSLPDNIKEAVESAKQKIIDGDITVPDGLSD